MNCPNCQKQIDDNANFCPQCGSPIQRCPTCHQPIFPSDRYCPRCGQPIHSSSKEADGYYQPISFQEEQPVTSQDVTQAFRDIPVRHKVNKWGIIIAVIALIMMTVLAYEYIYHGPDLYASSFQEDQDAFLTTDIEINGQNTYASLVGNVNQNGEVFFDGENLYMCDDNGYLVCMNKQLQDRQILLEEPCSYIQVVDQMIYYTDANHHLCQITTDKTNQKTLLNKAVYYLIADGNDLYYQLDEDDESLYVYHLDSQKQEKLNDRATYCINVVDDFLYYESQDGIYRIRKNGKDEEKILSGKYTNLIYQDQQLYYLTDEGVIGCFDLLKKETKEFTDQALLFINMNEDSIFYLSVNQTIVRYDLASHQEKEIYGGIASAGYMAGDHLILVTSSLISQDENYRVIMDLDGQVQQRLFSETQGEMI